VTIHSGRTFRYSNKVWQAHHKAKKRQGIGGGGDTATKRAISWGGGGNTRQRRERKGPKDEWKEVTVPKKGRKKKGKKAKKTETERWLNRHGGGTMGGRGKVGPHLHRRRLERSGMFQLAWKWGGRWAHGMGKGELVRALGDAWGGWRRGGVQESMNFKMSDLHCRGLPI